MCDGSKTERAGEIEVNLEMMDAGLRELAIICDPVALVSAVTGFDLRSVYIAMRRLEPGMPSSTHSDRGEDLQ